jgi:ankyrin repeat protein
MKNMIKCFLVTGVLAAGSFQGGSAMSVSKDERLLNAALMGDSKTVRMLLDAGANVDARDNYSETALIKAARHGKAGMVRMLLDAGANVGAHNHHGGTALREAAFRGHAEDVRILLDAGANVDAQDKCGRTALIMAAQEGHTEVVRMLLDAGADANLINQHKETALDLARKRLGLLKDKNDEETVELLENHQKDEQAAFDLLLEKWPDCPIEVAEHCIRPFGIKLAHPDQK